jgi:hypothetical protein
LLEVQTAPPLARERLHAPARVHVGDDGELVAVAAAQLVDGGRHVVLLGVHLQGAAGAGIRDEDLLVRMGERRDRVGHEVDGRLDDELRARVLPRLQRELVRIGDAAARRSTS